VQRSTWIRPGPAQDNDKALNRFMTRAPAKECVESEWCSLCCRSVALDRWMNDAEWCWRRCVYVTCPVLLGGQQADRTWDDKKDMLPTSWSGLATQVAEAEIVPVSALHGRNIDQLEKFDCRAPAQRVITFHPDDQNNGSQFNVFWQPSLVREKGHAPIGARIPLPGPRSRSSSSRQDKGKIFGNIIMPYSWLSAEWSRKDHHR